MEKNRNPNAAEIALPLNAFPVQSGFREKKKISISILIPEPKTKTITHLNIRHGEEPHSECRGNCPCRECVSCTYGFREKGKEHDLAAVNIDISMSILAPKTENKHAPPHSSLAETNSDVVRRLVVRGTAVRATQASDCT